MPFDTYLLDQARAVKRDRLEEERQHTSRVLFRLLDKRGAELRFSEAHIFGSLTQPGRFRPESDIDIAVEQLDAVSFFSRHDPLIHRPGPVGRFG